MASKVKTLLGLWFVLLSAATINVELMPALSAAPIAAQTIADQFSSVKSMSGDFVQSGPKGEKTSGRFFLKRAGKIRFNFAGQSGVSVIADGKSVVAYNKKLKTSRLYSLSKTPLKLLLDNKVDFSGGHLQRMKRERQATYWRGHRREEEYSLIGVSATVRPHSD
jgi:outer membrane lipoprotein-sorting protein